MYVDIVITNVFNLNLNKIFFFFKSFLAAVDRQAAATFDDLNVLRFLTTRAQGLCEWQPQPLTQPLSLSPLSLKPQSSAVTVSCDKTQCVAGYRQSRCYANAQKWMLISSTTSNFRV